MKLNSLLTARTFSTRCALALTLLALPNLAAPRIAFAQPSGQDAATAQALFDEGKRLMTEGKHAEACPKLVESQRIDPGGGTLFAIALCHEAEGKTATAWAEFSAALAEARKDHRSDRETAAGEHIRALEPKLTRLRIVASSKVPGLTISRDNARLGEAQWGTPLPIDPGEHTVEATAPGKRTWRTTVNVQTEGATIDVPVPVLEDEVIAAVPSPHAEPAPRTPPPNDSGGTQRTWAVVAGGVGVLAAAVGLGFGLSASSKWSEAEEACPRNRCTDPGKVKVGQDAGTAADVATVLVAIGGVGLATGLVLWLTAPATTDSKRGVYLVPSATTHGAGFALGGTL
jgi:hypothetical protein